MQTMVRWAIAATQGRSLLLDSRIIGSLRTVRRNLPAVAVSFVFKRNIRKAGRVFKSLVIRCYPRAPPQYLKVSEKF